MDLDLLLRPAGTDDAAAVAEVYLRAYSDGLPTVRRAHTDDEVRGWVRDVLVPRGGLWVADVDGVVVGLLALADGWVEQLHVDPSWQGRGIGSRLLALAKDEQPAGLQLWTFQVNRRAQAFYARHGFEVVETTDGAANEEREPDVRLVWRGRATEPGLP